MTPPESLVSWLQAELEARRAEIEGDFDGTNVGKLILDFNRNRRSVAVQTHVSKTYPPSCKTPVA